MHRPTAGVTARLAGILAAAAAMLGGPAVVLAHNLGTAYQSPLPLAVYLAGAAATVGLSFIFVLGRDVRAETPPPGRRAHVPAVVRYGLRLVGLVAWLWIMSQGVLGGTSEAAVGELFLWIFGWVGIAILTAFVFPVWEWLDPFTTIHDTGAWVLHRAGVRGPAPAELPQRARIWPAVAGLGFFIWLELVAIPGNQALAMVTAGYTVLTLALMAQFGRDPWRAGGDTFTVWFRTLNRLASVGIAPSEGRDADPDAVDREHVLRRPFASSLIVSEWEIARVVLVSFGTGSIIFDGLSQTVVFASVFGAPPLLAKTLLLFAFLGIITGAALYVARSVSPGAIGAGLLPIAVGYLVAHYLTYLLIGGSRIIVAISDPFQQGWDLFGTAFFEPGADWLPAGLVWTVQLASVVGGHMLGAWAGHVTAQRDLAAQDAAGGKPQARDLRHRRIPAPAPLPERNVNVRMREIPLAVVMVVLTTVTLWSLGQQIVVESEETAARAGAGAPVPALVEVVRAS
jgi:hypothetical protein